MIQWLARDTITLGDILLFAWIIIATLCLGYLSRSRPYDEAQELSDESVDQ